MTSKTPDRNVAAKRAALNALRRAARAADRAGVKLSDWEDEFLGSVAERVKTYGRAFADPDKGAPGQPLSVMQAVKLKEIVKKAKGERQAGAASAPEADGAMAAQASKKFMPRGLKRGFGGR